MKSTWPMRKFCIGDPTQTIFHWLALGFHVGVTQILGLALGVTHILTFLDTNMLVSAKQKSGVGGITQRQHQGDC